MLTCYIYQLFQRCCLFFFFNDTATTEIYTLSLHDALPISIIDDLKKQLGDLQAQLRAHQARQPPRDEGDVRIGPGAVDAGLTPHIASRMRLPAERLAGRLEALLGEIIGNLYAATANAIELLRVMLPSLAERVDEPCSCREALALAIWSKKSMVNPAVVERLRPIVGRYFDK